MVTTLTERQKEIVDFIRRYRERRGISPTQREICEEFGYSSFGTLQKHIRLLLEKGVLVRDWNKRRSLAPSGDESRPHALEVPLYGRIAAGRPIDVVAGDETVSVPEVLTRKGENFVLRVNGQSMIDDGVQDGDYIVVNRREKAASGDMVVALVNGEATLKRIYREGEGRVRLQPANEKMAPMVFREDEVDVQGIVVGLMRRF
ncbi:MAG TPA: transcriptional repressor LexA [Thermoanaerobaculia bacterium]|nr:transcriptional repressor LexA [Thermoanaerobaculia bacterium]